MVPVNEPLRTHFDMRRYKTFFLLVRSTIWLNKLEWSVIFLSRKYLQAWMELSQVVYLSDTVG